MRDYLNKDSDLRFVFPIDGDCLNCYDGKEVDGVLYVDALVAGKPNAEIYVNEVKAEFNGEYYVAPIKVSGYRTLVLAEDKTNNLETVISVFKLKGAVGGFRVSSDDNILFLSDINKNKDVYKSIFENPYLAVYKKAHDETGAKIHLNLFYSTDAYGDENHTCFNQEITPVEYFDLSMMTDKFKSEFEKNSDWLTFSFHSKAEGPFNPYWETTMKKITDDMELVHKEVIRFAGRKSLADITTIHYGKVNQRGVRAIRNAGYRGLAGYFEVWDNVPYPVVSYFYPKDLVRHVGNRDFWVDTELNIVYGRIELVLNNLHSKEENIEELKKRIENPGRKGFVEVMIHEQYFYKGYKLYIKNFEDIVVGTCKWLKDNGYTSRSYDEVMFDYDE